MFSVTYQNYIGMLLMKDPFKRLFQNMMMSGARSQRAKASHRDAHYPIAVSIDDIRRKYDEQHGRCFWTGMPLRLADVFESYNMEMPSIDRLDPTQGYDYDNIVITSRFLNVGRGRMSPERTRQFLQRVAKLTP